MKLLTPNQYSRIWEIISKELIGLTIERIFFDGELIAFETVEGISLNLPPLVADDFFIDKYWVDGNDVIWCQRLFPLKGNISCIG